MNPEDFDDQKRSVSEDVIKRSVSPYDGKPLKPADQPWFCFWNSTINEFFIYVDQAAPSEPNTTNSSSGNKYMTHGSTTTASVTSSTFTSWTDVTAAAMVQSSTMATSPTSGPTIFAAYAPTRVTTSVTASPTGPTKRSYDTSAASVSNYPKLIKMVEKRKPINPHVTDYVQPYCQKMQILWDWNIVPIETVPTICIEEVQYTLPTSSATSTAHNKMLRKRGERDAVSDLESYCICEWTSQ